MKHFSLVPLVLLVISCATPEPVAEAPAAQIPVRVVVVTMFENGEDSGDRPGEFQNWVERLPLDSVIEFPQGYRQLRYNAEKQVLGMVTGMGTARAAASVMALGMDPRFDLSQAYWLVAGIAGVDPEDASAGSAAWAEWLIDGDLSHEIDAREIPDDWATGFLPLRAATPYQEPLPDDPEGAFYHLNPELVDWAYQLTKDTELQDNEAVANLRSLYKSHPNAQKPPFVLKGDQLAASTYWHGQLLNQWANDWTRYWTQGKGNFVTSAMEDTGTLQSLSFLAQDGRANLDRVLVLRTASNYTMQYDGITAAESLSGEKLQGKGYTAFLPALDAAYRVGSQVVLELTDHWDQYGPGK
ncbi:Purine nucleoside permease [Catalinimonas alkaloidigena]|uniref:Purine nucleoside permease n=1 Tax=Catalinimonas alkaloidigena TaxID=1075417 RepID=A0A1G9GF18_9BACT|nr:purine nucleoside permease [Catalinimonas alkaloidigena]SDK99239.1 Purine nucleoside permease [Catalinimonas alkaloidigena]